ncbi:hypothetical protein OWM54_03675 [Myxococcus sp. MISCRS1]|nr:MULTISPECIES: hypothetical protein [unclassified Myxococcus]MBZ4402403.1 hypothetical protein [Myxococcus sp. AS-1-15]MCY0996230.1 hypothetical protein [Myxococcus sp. MISCRS1]BDT33787.1 hypothetical protein MFMH1_34560 [Myxococcus sp. MH1]
MSSFTLVDQLSQTTRCTRAPAPVKVSAAPAAGAAAKVTSPEAESA